MYIDSLKSQSFFHSIRSRELIRKRPFIDELALDFTEIGAIENNALGTPPLAISFCRASKNSHIFAVSDEAGYINLFDSRRKLSSVASHQENAEKARISDWLAHQNAIFDVCWIKEDTHILTASGDQTTKVWDAEENKCTGVLVGHTGSVKCLFSSNQFCVVKFWDTRNMKFNVTQACPHPETSTQKPVPGFERSISQASCMDNRIYLYNVLQLDKGPIQTFSGCQIESFYVKAAISPDADYILSGSSNGNAHIWKVNKAQVEPIILKSHHGEVTAIDWCTSEIGKMATSADDFTIRIWNIKTSYCLSSKSQSSIRRRVMAIPTAESSKLLMNENAEPMDLIKQPGSSYSSDEALHQINSSSPTTASLPSTPAAQKKKFSSISDSNETFEKTPKAAMKSPSSVLNPPSSLKRKNIRDYFLAVT